MLPPWLISAWQYAAEHGASDLHLRAGKLGFMRVAGRMLPLPESSTASWSAWQLGLSSWQPSVLSNPSASIDCRLEHAELGAGRCHLSLCQGAPSLVLRLLAQRLPTLAQMDMAPLWADQILQGNGLFLVTGATGSGKSSALTAWVQHWRQAQSGHVICLEDPIELIYPDDGMGLVTQREIGRDCASFADGLRSALRQDPDMVVMGEMRDSSTARLALEAAETGHSVLATLHTRDAISAIDRLLSLFPAEERSLAQAQLASCLRVVIAQEMHWHEGRAHFDRDVLVTNAAVRHAIREHRLGDISHIMQTHASLGMRLRSRG